MQIICIQYNPSKEICTSLVFLDQTLGYKKSCKHFFIFEIAWSRAFKKCIFNSFFYIFCTHFTIYHQIWQKKINFCKLAIFLQILKVEHNSFPMMYHLSYLDIKYNIQRALFSVSQFSSTQLQQGIWLSQNTYND